MRTPQKEWWFPKPAKDGESEDGRPFHYTHDHLGDALDQLDMLSRAYLELLAAQSDASRSAARSERERCASIVEIRGQTVTSLEYRIDAAKAKLLADDLRALPDANTDGAGEGAA